MSSIGPVIREPRRMTPAEKQSAKIISQSVTIIVLILACLFFAYTALCARQELDTLKMENHYRELCSLNAVVCNGEVPRVDNRD